MDIKTIEAAIEAILFASGEPVPAERLAQALEIDRATVVKIASVLMEETDAAGGGTQIVRMDDAYQMTTRPEYAPYVRKALDIRRDAPLSQAAMEVLAVVAYRQPVTRAYVEQVRGVDCSGTITSLAAKDLIEEQGRLDVPGRPILYGTSLNFLRCFGLGSLRDLPPVEQAPAAQPAGEETPPEAEN